MEHDRRRRKRVPFILKTEFIGPAGKVYYPLVRDISMSGILIQLDEVLPTGSEGEINIVLQCGDEKKTIKAWCKVVRTQQEEDDLQGGRMGLEILQIDSDSSIVLYNVIKYQDVS